MPAAKQPKTVTLVHPDGRKVQSSSPLEISRLHYGLGFALDKKGQTFTEAVEFLGKDAAFTEQVNPDAPVATDVPSVDAASTDAPKKK